MKLDKEKYTSESLTKVEALLEKVESIIDDENAAQAEVDEMYDQLHQALDQLVIKEDVNTNDKVEGDVTVIPTPEKRDTKKMIVLQQLKLVIQYLFKYWREHY